MENPVKDTIRIALQDRPANQIKVMIQKWLNLLFLHWEYDANLIQSRLPRGLQVDTYQGKAYMGIVPFAMKGIRPGFLPAVPWISSLLELNLRTYVYDEQGIPGVWFFSLDANKFPAVWLARRFFHLNYIHAHQVLNVDKETCFFSSHRKDSPLTKTSKFIYRPAGKVFKADQNSFSAFLTNRFILFSYDPVRNQLYRGRVFHPPYPLQPAEILQADDILFELNGFPAPGKRPDHAVLSTGVKVDIFGLEKI